MTAKQVQALRKKLKLTQREFAFRLKVEQATVSRWEREVTHPGLACVRKMERLARQNQSA